MTAWDWLYVAQAINPVGGLLVAIPLGVVKLHYPAWLAIASSVPLAYLQVIAVDLGWNALLRWSAWSALMERLRNARLERLAASRGAFFPTALAAPLFGPWVVMAVMRYARVPQRRVMAPILVGITAMASAVAALSVYLPTLVFR